MTQSNLPRCIGYGPFDNRRSDDSQHCHNRADTPAELWCKRCEALRQSDPVRSGRSDKYGQVYVERLGNTGFDDPGEPVALLRAQDKHALRALTFYKHLIDGDPNVTPEQRESVARQVYGMQAWQLAHPERVRTPGERAA